MSLMESRIHEDITRKTIVELKSERDALRMLGKYATPHCKMRMIALESRICKLESIARIDKWLMTDTPEDVYVANEELLELYSATARRYPTAIEERKICKLQDRIRPFTLFIRIFTTQEGDVWSSEYRLRREYYTLAPRDKAVKEQMKKTKQYPEAFFF